MDQTGTWPRYLKRSILSFPYLGGIVLRELRAAAPRPEQIILPIFLIGVCWAYLFVSGSSAFKIRSTERIVFQLRVVAGAPNNWSM
jgi:hypothetical protein